MKKILIALLIIAIFFVSGCIENTSNQNTETKYVCPDGSIVSDPLNCEVEKNTTTEMTTTTIEDEYIIKIINVNTSSDTNYLYITGEVKNNGSCPTTFTKVVAKLYKDNQFLKQYYDNVEGTSIPPDETRTFQMRSNILDYDYYTLIASGECFREIIYSEEITITK